MRLSRPLPLLPGYHHAIFPAAFRIQTGRVVNLRGVPLLVSTLRAGDAFVSRRTYTPAHGLEFAPTSILGT